MFEFTLDLGPLHVRFCLGDSGQPDETEGAASGGGVYSTHERVDYPLDPDAEVTIGFRPPRSTNG